MDRLKYREGDLLLSPKGHPCVVTMVVLPTNICGKGTGTFSTIGGYYKVRSTVSKEVSRYPIQEVEYGEWRLVGRETVVPTRLPANKMRFGVGDTLRHNKTNRLYVVLEATPGLYGMRGWGSSATRDVLRKGHYLIKELQDDPETLGCPAPYYIGETDLDETYVLEGTMRLYEGHWEPGVLQPPPCAPIDNLDTPEEEKKTAGPFGVRWEFGIGDHIRPDRRCVGASYAPGLYVRGRVQGAHGSFGYLVGRTSKCAEELIYKDKDGLEVCYFLASRSGKED